eukprot:5870471-Prymnesium_polylepis.1
MRLKRTDARRSFDVSCDRTASRSPEVSTKLRLAARSRSRCRMRLSDCGSNECLSTVWCQATCEMVVSQSTG